MNEKKNCFLKFSHKINFAESIFLNSSISKYSSLYFSKNSIQNVFNKTSSNHVKLKI